MARPLLPRLDNESSCMQLGIVELNIYWPIVHPRLQDRIVVLSVLMFGYLHRLHAV
jgi:hypothetical protein